MFPFIDEVKTVMSLLNEKGTSYLVGGAIRNYYFNTEIIDYDIATSLDVCDIELALSSFKTKVYANKRTVLVRINNIDIEVSPLKGNTIEEDLFKRDFTINAIAMDISGNIYDPYNGIKDIKEKNLKSVDSIENVINSDPLRILRAIRFKYKYNLNVLDDIKNYINSNTTLLKNVSNNRFKKELDFILLYDKPSIIIREYKYVFFELFPNLKNCYKFDQKNRKWHHLDVFEHILLVLDSTKPILEVRLAALFHDIDKPLSFTLDDEGVGHFYGHFKLSAETAKKNLRDLGYSKKIIYIVSKLVYYHDVRFSFENDSIDNFIETFGTNIDEINMIFNLMSSDIKGQNPNLLYRLDTLEQFRIQAIKIATIRNKEV